MSKISLTLAAVFMAFNCHAQIGRDCSNPDVISGLPFIQTGMTTQGFYDDYDNADCCASAYMTGQDYVFEYTPPTDINISIYLTNTGLFAGLFITKGCPDDPASVCIAFNEAQNGDPLLNGVFLQQDSTYFIIVSTYDVVGYFPYTPFDILIQPAIQIDAGVASMHNRSDCDLGNSVSILVEVENTGTDTLWDIPVSYSVNGGTVINEICTDTIYPLTKKYFGFAGTCDMSVPDMVYQIKVYTAMPGDGNSANDTLDIGITHNDYKALPYYEDFESGTAGWTTERIASSQALSSWNMGSPTATLINQAASGSNCWVTNSAGLHNLHERSFVLSPCFDFSSINLPVFEFNIWYETGSADYVILEYCLDNGYTWNTIGTLNDPNNWYNSSAGGYSGWNGSSGGWLNAKHQLFGLGGEPKVQFRVFFEGGINGAYEGFAFDDVKIYESPVNDVGVVDIVYPLDGCGYNSSDSVTVAIFNFGLDPQVNFDVAFSLNGGTAVTETVTDTIYSEDTLLFTFSQPVDLSFYGINEILSYTLLPADEDLQNDSTTENYFHFTTIATYPYNQDFESGDGGFYGTGFLSSWECGTPSGDSISSAASGSNAWCTNLGGTFSQGEQSFLYTPCFDFSSLIKPKVSFNLWYDVEVVGTQFEVSANHGSSWAVFGASADPQWYNQGYNWIGHSGEWVEMSHELYSFAGYPEVQFRYKFTGTVLFDGIGLDDFSICDEPAGGFDVSVNGLEVSFTDTSINADSWYWDFGDTTYSSDQNPVHIYTSNGTYTVMLIAGNTCNADTVYSTFYVTSVKDFPFSRLEIFPNPADRMLYIRSDIRDLHVTFSTVEGIVIYKFPVSEDAEIDISHFAPGVYIASFYTGNWSTVRKIIVR